MMGRPSDAPTPNEANEWRKSWRRTPSRRAALEMAAHGFLRSARGAPSFAPAITYGFAFDPRNVRQHLLSSGGEVEWLLACLAVGEEN